MWTDGSRLGSGKVVVWWKGTGWEGRPCYLGRKEVYDAEVYVIYRAFKIINQQEQSNRQYTIFSDSASAVGRIHSDRMGPGDSHTRGRQADRRPRQHGHRPVDTRAPGRRGQRGSRHLGEGRSREGPPARRPSFPPRGEPIVHDRRSERGKIQATGDWITERVRATRRYRPPRGSNTRPGPRRVGKALAGR